MLRQLLPDLPFVTFDDPDNVLAFHEDARGFLARFPGKVILDEVQRVPELFHYLKMEIDSRPDMRGRFVLSGSNQLLLTRGLGESLAGRVGIMELLPFETVEMPETARSDQLLRGSYPPLITADAVAAREWLASYFATYVEKDIRSVANIGDLVDFQRLARMAAARSSQEFNKADFARDIGISAKTVAAWVSVLEAGYIVHRLEPWFANIGKRLIKRPKLYFWDTGLACHLAGVRDRGALEEGPLSGALFETLVVSELRKRVIHRGSMLDFWFYRDSGGTEIDLVVEDPERRLATLIEIKTGMTPKTAWADRLDEAERILGPSLRASGKTVRKLVVYRGESRPAWPRPGIEWRNWDELAAEGSPSGI